MHDVNVGQKPDKFLGDATVYRGNGCLPFGATGWVTASSGNERSQGVANTRYIYNLQSETELLVVWMQSLGFLWWFWVSLKGSYGQGAIHIPYYRSTNRNLGNISKSAITLPFSIYKSLNTKYLCWISWRHLHFAPLIHDDKAFFDSNLMFLPLRNQSLWCSPVDRAEILHIYLTYSLIWMIGKWNRPS